jgi:hypothetical protein
VVVAPPPLPPEASVVLAPSVLAVPSVVPDPPLPVVAASLVAPSPVVSLPVVPSPALVFAVPPEASVFPEPWVPPATVPEPLPCFFSELQASATTAMEARPVRVRCMRMPSSSKNTMGAGATSCRPGLMKCTIEHDKANGSKNFIKNKMKASFCVK